MKVPNITFEVKGGKYKGLLLLSPLFFCKGHTDDHLYSTGKNGVCEGEEYVVIMISEIECFS